jgi:hypothetical protein
MRGVPLPPAFALLAAAALVALPGCAQGLRGDNDRPPYWRRPGPALLEPIERRVLPDDGFLDNLAAAPPAARLG